MRGRWRWVVDTANWQPLAGSAGGVFQYLLGLIKDPSEQQRIMRFNSIEDKKRGLVSCLLALRAAAIALGHSNFLRIRIARTKGGKPFLAEPLPEHLPNFNFSISHEGRYTALASDPLCLVGFDVSDDLYCWY